MPPEDRLFEPLPPPAEFADRRYAVVAVELGIDTPGGGTAPRTSGTSAGGGGGLTYWSTDDLDVGERVEVPLGRGDKLVAGVVVKTGGDELLGDFPPERVKAVARRTGAKLPPDLVELARWVAQYYVCPLGMALATLMPAAVKHAVGRRTRTVLHPAESFDDDEAAQLPPTARDLWPRVVEHFRRRPAHEGSPTAKELAAALGEKSVAAINRLIRAGALAESEEQTVSAGRAEKAIAESTADAGPDTPPTLTHEQAHVVEGIAAAGLDTFGVHLIRGVTGSGKTEVYLRLIEQVLDAGRSALILVPEIALTPQTAGRFIRRFGPGSRHNDGRGAGVAVLHSGLTSAQRHREWARAASGDARVVIGARSAIFAPMPALGMIVVDEEHDGSYKQDQLPRYHARDVAVKRASDRGIPVLLGSATPSLESWANAVGRTPRYQLWQLTKRVGVAAMPIVRVVDLAEEERLRQRTGAPGVAGFISKRGDPRKPQRFRQIGPTLENALAELLDTPSGQAILLLNRRGYASYLACTNPQCNNVFQCEHCDAAMVHHRRRALKPGGFVRCHHCLAEQKLPEACEVCGARYGLVGAGTQKVEEELAHRFGPELGLDPSSGAPTDADHPSALIRVDSDTMHSAREYFNALSRFAAGHARLLLGTQMIAKGLDFPNVRLVGVINADTAASLPDFRAAERTFQLVSQVAGRAGRAGEVGTVIVQTMAADSPAIRFAAAHDYEGFAAQELEDRAAAGLPPITRMARVVCRDRDYAAARQHAADIHDRLSRATAELALPVAVSMPHECVILRVADHNRFAVDLTSPARSAIQTVLARVRAEGALVSDATTAVDVDPITIL